MALSTSPLASWSAALQSIIPAPVRSRRAFTSLALISTVLTGSLPPGPDRAAAARRVLQAAARLRPGEAAAGRAPPAAAVAAVAAAVGAVAPQLRLAPPARPRPRP